MGGEKWGSLDGQNCQQGKIDNRRAATNTRRKPRKDSGRTEGKKKWSAPTQDMGMCRSYGSEKNDEIRPKKKKHLPQNVTFATAPSLSFLDPELFATPWLFEIIENHFKIEKNKV